MPRKEPTTSHPSPPFSGEEEASEENDAVKEQEPESPLKDRKSVSDAEDDYSENTAPSPNISDFIIKPIISESPEAKKPISKRFALSEPSGCGPRSRSRSKKETFDPPPFVVLGLPIQDNKLALPKQGNTKRSRKTKSDSTAKAEENVNSKMDSKRLSELLRREMLKLGRGNGLAALDVGIGVMDGQKVNEIGDNWRQLQQQMLELYIKRLELVQEQTKLVLDKLEASQA
ncbi:hypothetical protein CICLE_v10016550mg [Citrus x clementina]|uniref:Uncharacterized protein n=2 Tax=Citrus TaxID=2706 RepID=A0A067EXK8_CITSI|nr:hypothetical protein CICLE_v10016550mg [Citrus x clementina]KDO59879.1 hypothetical protein CISIN_1g027036mg [Citrus sinensis]